MDLNILSPYIRIAMYSTLPKGWKLERRVLYDYEIIYVQSGECIVTVDGKENICRAGTVVFLRPGIPHSFCALENSQFSQPHIHFDAVYTQNSSITPVSFKDIPQMTRSEKRLISPDVFKDIDIPTVFMPENPREFKKIFFELINLYCDNKGDILKQKMLMLELIRIILNQFEKNSVISETQNTVRIVAVKEYIDANYMHNISLDDIASYFSYNKYTLLRGFAKMYGDTVISYCNKKRTEAAIKLLTETSLSVREISEMLNFTDEYTFSRFFKNKCGVSPSLYREKRN